MVLGESDTKRSVVLREKERIAIVRAEAKREHGLTDVLSRALNREDFEGVVKCVDEGAPIDYENRYGEGGSKGRG